MALDSAEVVIVGGGVTGLSGGWWLARAGVDVVLVEKGIVGWEASGRNGGGVAHRGDEPPVIPLAAESLRLWRTLDDDLGYPTEFRPGTITVAMNERELAGIRQAHARYQDLDIETEIIDREAVLELLPQVSPDAAGGLYSSEYGQANPQRTSQAFAWAFQDRGGRIYQNTTVTGFTTEGGRVTSVETDRGEIATGFVVCAAGPQIGLLADMVGAFVPVAPARVEALVTAPLPFMWRGGITGNGLYGRQMLRGNLVYGGGLHEWIDVDLKSPTRPNTPLIRQIAGRLAGLFPGAADTPVIRSWGGVVEQTPDQYPILDVLEDPSNFLVATTSGHGFGISPATGKVISELVLKGESSIPVDGLRFDRFADVGRDWREEKGWAPAPERA